MDFTLSEEHQMIQETVRRFVQKELRPLEAQVLARVQSLGPHVELLPPEEQERLRMIVMEMGLWAMNVPEAFGGGGVDTLAACLVEEELGKTIVSIDLGDVSPVLFECTPAQQERYLRPTVAGERQACLALREPGQQIHIGTMATRATPTDGRYVLAGRKLCGREGKRADFFLAFVTAPQGVTCFLVDRDTPGLSITDDPAGPGVELVLDRCPLLPDNVLGDVGGGLCLGRQWAPARAMKIGARYVGMADRLLEVAETYARDWVTFGRPLVERPAVQRILAEMTVRLEAARWMVYRGAWTVDQGQPADDQAIKVRLLTWDVLRAAIDGTVQVYGGPSYADDLPMLRLYQGLVAYETAKHALDRLQSALSVRLLELASRRCEKTTEVSKASEVRRGAE